jgi:serine/threonine-protein kinase
VIGTVLASKYRIEQLLGEGGMGAVYLAENVAIGRTVAIKLLHAELARDPTLLQRFRQEARAAAAIGHPGIVDVLDLGQTDDGAAFIVMERLEGETLGRRIERFGRLPVDDAIVIADRILDALGAAHARGILHRDLKPDNVFLVERPAGGVKLVDFGLSKLRGAEDAGITQTGAVMGTPLYMAPEQARGLRDVGPAADFYSVGAILYHMLAGVPPFQGDSVVAVLTKLAMDPHRPLDEVRPGVPAPLASLVDCLLTKSPAVRLQDATAARDMLRAAGMKSDDDAHDAPLGHAPTQMVARTLPKPPPEVGASSLAPAPAPPQRPRSRAAIALPIAAGAALALVGGVWLTHGRARPPAPTPVALAPAPVAAAPAPTPTPAPVAAAPVPTPTPAPTTPAAAPDVVVTVAPIPAAATLSLDGQELDCARPCPIRAPAGSRHQLRATARGYVARPIEIVFDRPRDLPLPLERSGRVAAARPAAEAAPAHDNAKAAAATKPTAPGILDEDLRSGFPHTSH